MKGKRIVPLSVPRTEHFHSGRTEKIRAGLVKTICFHVKPARQVRKRLPDKSDLERRCRNCDGAAGSADDNDRDRVTADVAHDGPAVTAAAAILNFAKIGA